MARRRAAGPRPRDFSGAARLLGIGIDGATLEVHDDLMEGDAIAIAFAYRNRSFTLHATVLTAEDEEAPGDDNAPPTVITVRFENVPPLTAGRLASVLDARTTAPRRRAG